MARLMHNDTSPRTSSAFALLLGIPIALYVLAVLELVYAPYYNLSHFLRFSFRVTALVINASLWHFMPLIGFQLGLAIICAVYRKRHPPRTLSICLAAILSAGVTYYLYYVLTLYKAFAGHLPFVAAYVAFSVLLFGWSLTVLWRPRRWIIRWLAPVFGILGFLVLHVMNHRLHRDAYPSLHLSSFMITYLLLHAGIAGLLLALKPFGKRGRKALLVGGAVIAALVVLSPIAVGVGLAKSARSVYLRFTIPGQANVLFEPEKKAGEQIDSEVKARIEKEILAASSKGIELFEKHSNLPELPPEFDLSKYNILLISLESNRFDDTSVADPNNGVTPALGEFARAGNFWFDTVYSPSSQTMLVMSSIFSMTYPSACQMDLARSGFNGELLETSDTVTELLAQAGYYTFWTGHNCSGFFTTLTKGIGQGFMSKKVFHSRNPRMDPLILKQAIAQTNHAKKDGRPFFGWVFFGSPHYPYEVHYDDMPSRTQRELYRQELRFVDEHVGKLLAHVKKLGLLDSTVIIIHGDHGEAFMEHGKNRHNDIYQEVARVPLVIHIPGIEGRRMRGPTSLTYLFPWLFLNGPEQARAAAINRLSKDLGPMLANTGGAIVSEKMSAYNMRSALRYPDYVLIHDFPSDYNELYHLETDPEEQNNQFGLDPQVTDLYLERLQGYLTVRGTIKRYRLTDAKAKKKKAAAAKKPPDEIAEPKTDTPSDSKQEALKARQAAEKLAKANMKTLIEAVGDPERLVRAAAVAELGRRGKMTKKVIEALVPALADPDRMTRHAATRLVAEAGNAAIGPLIRAHHSKYPHRKRKYESDFGRKSIFYAIREILLGIGKPAVPKLIRALNHRDLQIRANASFILSKMGPRAKAAVPRLLRATRDRHWLIRRNAIGDLPKIDPQNPKVVAAVKRALKDKHEKVRVAATKSWPKVRRYDKTKKKPAKKPVKITPPSKPSPAKKVPQMPGPPPPTPLIRINR